MMLTGESFWKNILCSQKISISWVAKVSLQFNSNALQLEFRLKLENDCFFAKIVHSIFDI